jgi:hypothetical protein
VIHGRVRHIVLARERRNDDIRQPESKLCGKATDRGRVR